MNVPIGKLQPNPEQPRQNFDQFELNNLAASIEQHGIIQPIVVEPNGDGYMIHDGERRWRAAQIAGLIEVPIVLSDSSTEEKTRLLRAVVANVQRANLNDIELADAYQQMSKYGLSDQEIAMSIGQSRSNVANLRRLTRLPKDMRLAVTNGTISTRVALAYLPALDIKTHLIPEAYPKMIDKPSFHPAGNIPTPGALRKRLCDPDANGGPLTSTLVRNLVEEMKQAVTIEPCSECGRNTKRYGASYLDGRKLVCRSCFDKAQDIIIKTYYCQSCGHSQEINGKKIRELSHYYTEYETCTQCGAHNHGYDWKDIPPPRKKEPEYKPLVLGEPDKGPLLPLGVKEALTTGSWKFLDKWGSFTCISCGKNYQYNGENSPHEVWYDAESLPATTETGDRLGFKRIICTTCYPAPHKTAEETETLPACTACGNTDIHHTPEEFLECASCGEMWENEKALFAEVEYYKSIRFEYRESLPAQSEPDPEPTKPAQPYPIKTHLMANFNAIVAQAQPDQLQSISTWLDNLAKYLSPNGCLHANTAAQEVS